MVNKVNAFQVMRDQRTIEIVHCAKQKFLTNGISNTSMKEIAEALSITRATLYKYFSTIDELVYEIEFQALSTFEAWINQTNEIKGSAIERFEQTVDLYLSLFRVHADDLLFTAMFDSYYGNQLLSTEAQKQLEDLIHHFDHFYQLILEGIEDGTMRPDIDPGLTNLTITNLLIAMMQRMVVRGQALSLEQGFTDFDDLFKDLKKMMIYYVRKEDKR